MTIGISKIVQYTTRPKNPMKSVLGECGKQVLISAPAGIAQATVLAPFAGPLSIAAGVINLVRTFNRWAYGLYFKFEKSIGQQGLAKFSEIDFSQLQRFNLNKLAKGKIHSNIPEALKFRKIAQEVLADGRRPNFNILKRVDIYKSTRNIFKEVK